jgi:hypothetical protein
MSFFKGLSEILGFKDEEKKEEIIEEKGTPVPEPDPEDEFENPKPEDPDAVNDFKPVDKFKDAIDAVLFSEGIDVQKEIRRKYKPTTGDMSQHDWEMAREKLFSEEPYVFKCKRCLIHVEVGNEQTMNQALEENEVELNCAQQVVNDIENE